VPSPPITAPAQRRDRTQKRPDGRRASDWRGTGASRRSVGSPSDGGLHGHHLYPGGQRAGPVAVAEIEALLGSLMALGTDHGSVLQLVELLQAVACRLEDQLHGRAAIE